MTTSEAKFFLTLVEKLTHPGWDWKICREQGEIAYNRAFLDISASVPHGTISDLSPEKANELAFQEAVKVVGAELGINIDKPIVTKAPQPAMVQSSSGNGHVKTWQGNKHPQRHNKSK